MKIYRSIQDYNEEKRSVVTIGTFDGLHQGHQKIFSRLINSAKTKNLSSVILTFFPHPRICLLYTSPSPRDRTRSRMPSSA